MRARVGATNLFAALGLAVGLTACSLGGLVGGRDADTGRLHQQAEAALARWADAVAAAGGHQGFVPVGDLTGQVGDWEEQVGENNKPALIAGMIEPAVSLSAEAPPDGQLQWPDGTTQTLRLISAQHALSEIQAAGEGDCKECQPLRITGAQVTSRQVRTSRGPATAPVWEFTLEGTAVRVTRVAVAERVVVVPPPRNANDPPAGLSVESAVGAVGGRQLTVSFTGATAPGSQPCGEDYTGEGAESPTAVVVIVIPHPHGFGEACAGVGAARTATVELAAPLGKRTVLEVVRGLPIPVRPGP